MKHIALNICAICVILMACTPIEEYTPPEMAEVDTMNAVCDIHEARQFDFWLGDWELTWGDSGKGTNSISRILNQCIIQENFSGEGFRGISMSAYNRPAEEWKQTWVDNNGTYLDFTGGWMGDRMILSREALIQEIPVVQRMVWYNISEDTMDWNWEISRDGGETWNVNWKIDYTRRK